MQRLSTQDASFLHLEDAVSHMHVGAVALFEGPAPREQEFLGLVGEKLPRVPQYRQRVRFVPLALGPPVWVDDRHFDIGYHLRRTALPEPGGEEQLRLLIGRVMSHQLDRRRPLWEMWLIEGLEGGRWGLLTKVHHAMVDGVSGSELLSAVLDEGPGGAGHAEGVDGWRAERQPSGAELAARALGRRARSPLAGVVRSVLDGGRGALGERVGQIVEGVGAFSTVVLRVPPPSSLNGPIGPARRWALARTSLAEVKGVRRALGGTVNDVVLAAIAGGFRELLMGRGESPDRVVRTLVPVSVRGAEEHGKFNNRVSAIFADLPVGIEDPVARLRAVIAQMNRLKASHEAEAGDALVALSGVAPAMLLAIGMRVATRLPQHSVNTVTTNVPGPQQPLYAAGRRMLECFPYVPLGGHVRVGVAVFSYDGQLGFGVTGDWRTAPDIEVLCDGIERSVRELVGAAGGEPIGRAAAPGTA